MKALFCALALSGSLAANAQDTVYPFFDGKLWGITDQHCNIITPPQFEREFAFSSKGFAQVYKDKHWGSINGNGHLTIPCIYDGLVYLTTKLAAGQINSKTVLLDPSTGKQISPFNFDQIGDYCHCDEDLIITSIGGKKMFINTINGRQLGESSFEEAFFTRSLRARAFVKSKGKFGVIDTRSGKWVVPAIYDQVSEGLVYYTPVIEVTRKGVSVFKDLDGKTLSKEDQEKLNGVLPEGVTIAQAVPDEEWNGAETVRTVKNDLFTFRNTQGAWSVVLENYANNKKTEERIELKDFDEVSGLYYKYAWTDRKDIRLKAIKNGRAGIIDLKGNALVPFQYDTITYQHDCQCFHTRLNGKTGILQSNLAEVKKPVLKAVLSSYNTETWLVEMPDGKRGCMHKKTGKIYIPGVDS
jgi:hypothetical protein